MTPLLFSSALLGQSANLCAVIPATELMFTTSVVRVGDLIELDCVPPSARTRLGAQVLLDARERTTVTLSRAGLATLARRRAPMLRFSTDQQGEIQLRFSTGRSDTTRACLHARGAIASGAALDRSMVALAPCPPSEDTAPIRYDATTGQSHAITDIPSGAPLGPVLVPQSRATQAGDSLTLQVRAGPVTITRPVEALQSAQSGERVFVRDAEGQVFSVQLESIAP
jgi:hypothetical protein